MKKSYKFFLYAIALLAIGEFGLRYFGPDSLHSEVAYRQMHCFSWTKNVVHLCPNVNQIVTGVGPKDWELLTNGRGERVIPSRTSEETSEEKEIWLLGDSMAMGYGLPSEETIPAFLPKSIPVRSLAVDAIGTEGIFALLDASLREKQDTKAVSVYWIWNPSDFIDDAKQRSPFVLFLRYSLLQKLYLFHLLLAVRPKTSQENNYQIQGPPLLYPTNHKTYQLWNERKRKQKFPFGNHPTLRFRTVFAWGMARNGKPDTTDGNYSRMKSFWESIGVQSIDLRADLEKAFQNGDKVYLPFDGHPDLALSQRFAKAISEDFVHAP